MISGKPLSDYLNSWLDNVGRSVDDDETIASAMLDMVSLAEWGLIESRWSDVEYDHDEALEIIRK